MPTTPRGYPTLTESQTYALVTDYNKLAMHADATNTVTEARAQESADAAMAYADKATAEVRAIAQAAYDYNQALGGGDVKAQVDAVVTDPQSQSGKLLATKADASSVVRLGDRDVDAVRQFGAPTDGVTSAAAQLQAAADAAGAGGGKRRLILRAGTYKGSAVTPWKIPQGVTVQGEGPSTRITGHRLMSVSASDVLFKDLAIVDTGGTGLQELFHPDASSRAFKNWRFENCTINGTRIIASSMGTVDDKGAPLADATGLADHLEFSRCEVTGYKGDGALWNRGIPTMNVDGCWLHDIGTSLSAGDMIKYSFGGSGRISNNTAHDGTRDFIDLYDGANVIVSNNRAWRFQAHGIEAKRTTLSNGVGGHKILDNWFEDCNLGGTSSGVALQLSAPHMTVRGNTVRKGIGVGFRGGAATDDATLFNHGGTWTDNRAIAVTGHGFTAMGVSEHLIVNNVATGCALRGFYVPSVGGATVYRGQGNRSWANGYADDWAGATPA